MIETAEPVIILAWGVLRLVIIAALVALLCASIVRSLQKWFERRGYIAPAAPNRAP